MRFEGTLRSCSACDTFLATRASACPTCGAEVATLVRPIRTAASVLMGLAVAVGGCGDDAGTGGAGGDAGSTAQAGAPGSGGAPSTGGNGGIGGLGGMEGTGANVASAYGVGPTTSAGGAGGGQ
jgi:hypothetical protein